MCSDDIRSAELLARNSSQLTANNMITGAFIASNGNFINCCLIAFKNSHLYINRISCDRHLNGHDAEKQIAIIHVETTDISAFRIECYFSVD